MRTDTLVISGMTCATCAAAVERAVRKVAGVATADVNLATEKLSVSYDPASVTIEAVKEAVHKAGYEAAEAVSRKEVTIPIEGMT